MQEELIIEQDFQIDPPQTGDPLEKLYKGLKSDGKYTKSYDEFKKKYSSPDSIDFLYAGLNNDKDYTKTKDDFYNQYFPSLKKKNWWQRFILWCKSFCITFHFSITRRRPE